MEGSARSEVGELSGTHSSRSNVRLANDDGIVPVSWLPVR